MPNSIETLVIYKKKLDDSGKKKTKVPYATTKINASKPRMPVIEEDVAENEEESRQELPKKYRSLARNFNNYH